MKIEPAARRTRYRSEPGMIGNYPWSYKDDKRRFPLDPAYEEEHLFTEAQMRQAMEACAAACALNILQLIKEMLG